MKKNNKIFLVIIIVLLIFSGTMTALYFNMRATAKKNLEAFLQATEEKYELNNKISDLEKQLENK